MFNLLYLIALPSLFLLVLCGLYGLALAVLGQKEKALTERQSQDGMQNGNVGTHKPRPREALGLLADARMRAGKQMCHAVFDSKWKGKPKAHKKRQDLYRWLAQRMDIPIDDCHFGYFDLTQLRKAYKILLEIKDQELKYDNNGNIVN